MPVAKLVDGHRSELMSIVHCGIVSKVNKNKFHESIHCRTGSRFVSTAKLFQSVVDLTNWHLSLIATFVQMPIDFQLPAFTASMASSGLQIAQCTSSMWRFKMQIHRKSLRISLPNQNMKRSNVVVECADFQVCQRSLASHHAFTRFISNAIYSGRRTSYTVLIANEISIWISYLSAVIMICTIWWSVEQRRIATTPAISKKNKMCKQISS